MKIISFLIKIEIFMFLLLELKNLKILQLHYNFIKIIFKYSFNNIFNQNFIHQSLMAKITRAIPVIVSICRYITAAETAHIR